jgi:hypothetical protein
VASPDEASGNKIEFKSLPSKTDYLIGKDAKFSFSDEDIASVLGTENIIQNITADKLLTLLKKAQFTVDFDMTGAELVFVQDGDTFPMNISDCTFELVDPPTVDVFAEAEGYDSVDAAFEAKKEELEFVVDLIKNVDATGESEEEFITSTAGLDIDDSVAALIEGPYKVNVKYGTYTTQFTINLVSDGGFVVDDEEPSDGGEIDTDLDNKDSTPATNDEVVDKTDKTATPDTATTTKPTTISGSTTGSNSVKTGQTVGMIIAAVSLLFISCVVLCVVKFARSKK